MNIKPDNCTCTYPIDIFRNFSGHDPSCPVHKEHLAGKGILDGLCAPLETFELFPEQDEAQLTLTEAERQVILDIRLTAVKKRAKKAYRLHLLLTTLDFARWKDKNGAGSSYSTFCDDFGYGGRKGEDRQLLYNDVLAVLEFVRDRVE